MWSISRGLAITTLILGFLVGMAAAVIWGQELRTPTQTQMMELIQGPGVSVPVGQFSLELLEKQLVMLHEKIALIRQEIATTLAVKPDWVHVDPEEDDFPCQEILRRAKQAKQIRADLQDVASALDYVRRQIEFERKNVLRLNGSKAKAGVK